MWIRTYSKVFKDVSSEAIWGLWKDIDNWPSWHGDLDSCELVGGFQVGGCFYLKPKGQKPVKISLIDIKEGRSFTDSTKFFGAEMRDTHELEQTPEGLKLTNILTVTGPLKWLWIKLVANYVADTVPDETEALVNLARGNGG